MKGIFKEIKCREGIFEKIILTRMMSSTNFQKLHRFQLELVWCEISKFCSSWFDCALYRFRRMNISMFMALSIKEDNRANQGLSQSESRILDNCLKLDDFVAFIKIATFILWSRLRAHSNQLAPMKKNTLQTNSISSAFNCRNFVDDIPVDRIFFSTDRDRFEKGFL